MDCFYSDAAKVAAHNDEALAWLGTPFAAGGRAKGRGGGIDCVGFIEEVHAAAGIERFNFPRDEGDFHPQNHNDKILRFLRGTYDDPQSKILAARFAELKVDDVFSKSAAWPHAIETKLMPGDLVIMRGGPGIWHIATMLDARNFMHCAWPGGVTQPTDITPPNYQKACKAVFRARATPLQNEESLRKAGTQE